MVSESAARPDPVTGRHLTLRKAHLKSAGLHPGSVISRGVLIFWLQAFFFARFSFFSDGELHRGSPFLQVSKLLVQLSK